MRAKRTSYGLLYLAVSLLATAGMAQPNTTQEHLPARVEQLRSSGELQIGEATIAAFKLIPEIYEERRFGMLWTDPARIEELLGLIARIDREGLLPEDYHLSTARALFDEVRHLEPQDPVARADLDMLLTDALIRLGYHLRFGKVDPEQMDPDWNFSRSMDGRDPVEVVLAVIESASITEYLDHALRRQPFYKRFEIALAEYRKIAANGGWPQVPQGPVLKPGARDQRVVSLRERLAVTGDLGDAPVADRQLFDESLKQAVIRFQERHDLDADGIVGRDTLNALNVPVERRIDQFRISMERARWVFHDIQGDFIVTNIAGFYVLLIRDEEIVWRARAVVGKPFRKTPVFKADLKYLVFSPTWTVPPTILRKDVLPKVKEDLSYLERKNMVVLDRKGKVIDPTTLDWDSYTGRNFPYAIRQQPGPHNALGRVKFIFPNEHFVFLHDTPSRELFKRSGRTFSSGCIRVENPFELAELLLEDPVKWNHDKIVEASGSDREKTVFLPEQLPVLLLYWTADVNDNGVIHFHKDVYNRDKRILDALNAPLDIEKLRKAVKRLRDR